MRLVLCVDNFVTAECRGLPKAFSADLANKRPGSSVDRHVPCEIVVGIEDFPTLRTCEGLRLHANRS